MLRSIFLILGILALAGCVSTNAYLEPSANTEPKPATITGYYNTPDKILICHLQAARLSSIDGKHISYNMFTNQSEFDQAIKIAPGQHELVIHNFYNSGCGSTKYEGLTDLIVNIQPGFNYKLGGSTNSLHANTWLVDASGKKVSQAASAPMEAMPDNAVIY